jgi:GrpB-like predicted nucleotidyltransferase (UPF0157 family)
MTYNKELYIPPLEAHGYTLRIREPDWYQHRLLKPPEIAGNLHVFSAGCEEIAQMLLFRDWLRNHAADRMLYEATKRDLAAQTWKYTQNYADAKGAVITGDIGARVATTDSHFCLRPLNRAQQQEPTCAIRRSAASLH